MRKAESASRAFSRVMAGIRSKQKTARPESTSPFARRPNVIVCDLLLPRISGLQVCRAIREKLDSPKIIIVAGRIYDIDRDAVLEAGGDGYFVKPLKWEKLAAVIKRPRRPRRKLTPRQSRALKFHPPSTRIKFWGVRGSTPFPARRPLVTGETPLLRRGSRAQRARAICRREFARAWPSCN